jgi:K+/H+ antiporter YhaU regulatory subunit KhtT
MALIFADGMEIETSGPYRIIEETDGLYVVGNGRLCAVATHAEGEKMINDLLAMRAIRGDAPKTH